MHALLGSCIFCETTTLLSSVLLINLSIRVGRSVSTLTEAMGFLLHLVEVFSLTLIARAVSAGETDPNLLVRTVSRNSKANGSDARYPIAYTNQGTVRGTHLNNDVSAFLGIPYARPPVGDLRFRPPVPLPRSDSHEVLDASIFGPVCHQFHYRTVLLNNTKETTPQSEDCLNLNVFVPRNALNDNLLPTLLWSYGGGFSEGGGSVRGTQAYSHSLHAKSVTN